nr:hypothetical protein [Tanacetum cinerariifolium]
ELALMYVRMFPKESDKIKKYAGGLPDMIYESVMATKPKTMQDAIKFGTELMDKKIYTLVKYQAENKRKLDNNNQAQQQPPKKQGVAIAYTIGPGERKEIKELKPASPATTTTITTPVINAQLKALIDQGIVDALAVRDADRSMNGDESHNSGTSLRRQAPLTRECTYSDFMKCKPLYFKGTEGVVELTQWFKRMETVNVGHDVAYAMTWTNLKKKMTDKYCPRGEIKKLRLRCGI